MDERNLNYIKQLEGLGFYVNGRPAAGTLEADTLRAARKSGTDAQHIDRSFKYGSVLDESKLGISDVFELDGSPCIYFKSVAADPSDEQLANWHKAAWNHGLARMLWICTPTQIRIFNAFAPPPEDTAGLKSRDVLLFESVADQLEEMKSNLLARDSIESGEFWFGPIGKRIRRKTRIDEQLAEDLTLAAKKLGQLGLAGVQAHRLLLRTVFIAYLEAKGVLPDELFDGLEADTFEEVLSGVAKTRTFFARMAGAFNGDLFPPPPREASLSKELTRERLRIPQCILARTDLTTLQQSFKFWRYDFSVIPIELISSIYEKFIHTASPREAAARGTHYTPVNVVDFLLTQVFDDGLFGSELSPEAKVLDLSCGSGVFLVESLRRLIAKRLAAGEKHTRDLVRDVLYNQVYGVDIEETAVEIAAFSLCLTAFELDPVPNSHHQLKFKHELKGRTLFVGDAFDPDGTFHRNQAFADKQFDVVVGNPPWTRPKGKRSVTPSGEQRYLEYCRNREPTPVTLPFKNPPDQAFVWRSRDFARRNARIGMVLEGKRFFSQEDQSLRSKQDLLRSFEPALLVNLAAMHDQKLFPSAKQPAVILVAANRESNDRASFPFVSVEFARPFRNHGILQIGPENVQRLSISLAATNAYALKVASWGSARDMALVDRLIENCDALEAFLAEHEMEMHQGYIEGTVKNRTREVPPELHGLPCLTGGGMFPFEVTVDELPPFEADYLQWPRAAEVYRGPLVLAASALRGNRIVAAYCHNDMVYSLSQFGVSFAKGKRSLAPYLNAVLNSSLATYFVFLTATKWGLEKYEILENDVLRLPIPRLEQATARDVDDICDLERELRKSARNDRYDTSLVAELDKAVFKLYGLDRFEQVLVEDMVNHTIDLQRNHEKSETLLRPSVTECRKYAEHVIAVIQPFLEMRKKRRLVADVLDANAPLQVVRFTIMRASGNGRPNVGVEKVADLNAVLNDVARNLDEEISRGIHTRRHLRVYSGDSIYVVKPSQRRFWTRSAGLNDGDAILKDLLTRGGGE